MDSENNPIKSFFSASNARALYQTIQQGLQERYQTTVDDRYLPQLVDIMKMVVEPLPKRIPANVDRERFTQSLNKQVLKEAVPLFAEIALNKHQPDQPHPTQKQHHMEHIPDSAIPLVPPPSAVKVTPLGRPQSTPLRSLEVDSDEAALQQMVNERTARPALGPQMPKFEDEEPEYPDDINDLYEWEEQTRQQQQQLEEQFHREAATREAVIREAPREAVIREAPREAFINDAPPRGAERALDFNPPPPRFDSRIQPEQQRVGSDALAPIAPQPTEYKLIPTVSRNIKTQSRAIPNIYVLHSSDRNQNTYPSASDYRIQLQQMYHDVEAVELSCAMIPLSGYNVNATNNVINFEEVAGTTLTAIIPEGNYPDATSVAFAVETSLNAATTLGVTYSATVDLLTGKITITSDGAGGAIFTLQFFGAPTLEGEGPTIFQREKPAYPPNSIGPVLGYNPIDYAGALTYLAPNVPNIDGEPAVYLHIEEIQHIESNNSEVCNAFACIPLCSGQSGVGCGYARFVPEDSCRFVKYFSPPEGKLANLTISLRTASGAIYDFNGRDHSLTFTITTIDKTQDPYTDTVVEDRD